MRSFYNQILSITLTFCIAFLSINNINASNKSVIDCQAFFHIFSEGPLIIFDPMNHYDDAVYEWDFGDGNTSNEMSPIHVYEADPNNFIFTVTLTITQADGEICAHAEEFVLQSEECTSMFVYSVESDGVTVNFEDTSWGIITSWLWDFGDGNTSTEEHPVHVYENGGIYEVNLTVNCLGGETNSMPMPINVEYEPIVCDASFSMDWFQTEYYFFPNTVIDDAIYNWDFGDGATSNEVSPMHIYQNTLPGDMFIVSLQVTFPDGEICTYSQDIVIEEIDECTSMFDYFAISDDGLTISFQDQSWGNITSWQWDFGDGNTSIEQHPEHIYSEYADYEVFLTIVCANGEINTMVMPVHVGNGGDCDAFFWYYQELNQVYFHPNNEDPTVVYEWDFGDGTTSNEIQPVHVYDIGNEPSEYNVSLTITFPDGSTCNYNEVIFLEPLECTSMFDYFPTDNVDLEIQFTDQSWGIPTSWLWDFGDGNTSSEQNPVHLYAEPGVYNVTLTIDCVGGETNAMEMPAIVGDVQFCDAGFWYEMDFSFTTFYFTPFSVFDDATYNWDFGDGNTSSEINPVHTYNQGQDPVEYIVTLVLTLSDGQVCTYEDWLIIEPVECNAMFEYGPAPDNGLVIAFFDTSWGTPVSWLWDFGDGHTSTEQNPTHQYENEDVYQVTLTITCIGGEVNTVVMEVHTSGTGQCYAAFEYYILDDLGVYFETALIYEDAEYFWDFGDGEFSGEMMPTHYYNEAGWYPVFLEIILPNGTYCHYDAEILIGADDPDLPIHCEAFFNFEQLDDPMVIQFFNESFTDNDQIELQWHFGDGTTSTEINPTHQYEEQGIYIVTLTIISGDCVDTFPMQIFVGDETFYPEGCQALFLPVSTSSGYIFYDLSNGIVTSYLWDFGDGNLSTNETPFHDYAIPGEYEVTLTITTEDGCESSFSIAITNTGYMGNAVQAYMISSTDQVDFITEPKVYPNPSIANLNIEFELSKTEVVTVDIISVDGKVIYSTQATYGTGIHQRIVDVSGLPNAIYLIKITTDSNQGYQTRFAKL